MNRVTHSEWCDRMNGGFECNCDAYDPKPPHELDVIVDTVLAYKPKDKSQGEESPRKKKKAKRDAKRK